MRIVPPTRAADNAKCSRIVHFRVEAMSAQPFDYSLDFKRIDFRQRPELYCVSKGEQGGAAGRAVQK